MIILDLWSPVSADLPKVQRAANKAMAEMEWSDDEDEHEDDEGEGEII